MSGGSSKLRYILSVISAIAVLSACSGNTPAVPADTAPSSAASETVISTAGTPEETSAPQQPETSESTETSAAPSEESKAEITTVSGTEEQTDSLAPEISEEVPETGVTTASETAPETPEETSAPAETAAAPETTTVSSAETTTEISTSQISVSSAAEVTEKHEPSPPVISRVSSDGVNVFECKKGIIDYSNANKGYISAMYLGNKKLAKLRITCGDSNYDYTLTADGKYHYFTLSTGSGNYTAKMFEQADGKLYSDVIGGDFKVKIEDDVRQYTYTNEYVCFNENSSCVAKASEICGGCTGDIEKIGAIFLYVSGSISYDYELAATVKSFYVPDPDATLSTKKGVCFDYSSLMAAMLRSQGIPTRLLIGYAKDIYHAWNEVYTKETGWVTLEILLKDKGFNILDSTFYSTSDDKKWVADLMANKANYTKIYTY